jgi:S-DNA-T family DNA segregation ATPase FtsK/SpoIIIE
MASHNDHPNPNHDDGRPIDWDGEFAKLDTAGNVVPFQRKPGHEVERFDTSYEATLDDDQEPLTGELLPPKGAADPGFTVTVPTGRDGREPIIPAAYRPENIKATVRLAVQRALHVAGFHAVRAPIYAAKTAFWAVVGGFKLVKTQVRWWWLAEQFAVRQALADNAARDPKEAARLYSTLHREGKATRRWRGIVLAGQTLGVTLGSMALWNSAPLWATVAAGAVATGALARYGRPAHKPILSRAVIAPRFRKINLDIVLRAYYAAGLGNPDKETERIDFGGQMARDGGTGSSVVVNLPYGRTYSEVIRAKEKIASGLDVSLSQVFITRDPSSNRSHNLWIADRDPLATPAGRTSLLSCKATDIWGPAPFGLDERGRVVSVNLLWSSFLIGAQPRQGKTFSARLLALFAALDPHVRLSVFDFKASPDWRKFALVADRCAFGLIRTKAGDPIEIFLDTLRAIKADVMDRNNRLSELPTDICPEGKLTRDIARDPKYRMPVHLVVIDEFQEAYGLGEASKEAAELLKFLVKVGPSVGIIVISSTQKPAGVGGAGPINTAFNDFRDNHIVRFALNTGSWQVSDKILGDGAYSEGHDSSTLLSSYKGVGILRGAFDHTPTVRTHLADAEDAEKILKAARVLRERAGTLSGMAAGQDTAREYRDVLADVRAVFGTGEPGLHWTTIAARLAERLPEHYADATAEAVSAQLRALNVASVDVKRDGTNLKGAKLAAITAAIEKRTAT